MRLLTKKELEEIALSEIVDGPQWNVSGSRVFEIRREWVKWGSGRSGADCQSQYDGRTGSGNEQPCGYGNFFAGTLLPITSASLVQLLERSPLAKNIYAAFEIRL